MGDRTTLWASSDPVVVAVDSASGVVVAQASGTADIKATSEGKVGIVRITVLPQPRTSRAELAAESATHPTTTPPAGDGVADWKRVIDQMLAGVGQCYGALQAKDLARVEELYQPETKADRDKLKKLGRILRTREWAAEIGERKDGAQRIDAAQAAMEFSFQLSWKDAFGGRLRSEPVFRAEFVRNGAAWDLSSCRIVGSPRL